MCGLSTRDIEAQFADERGQSLLSRTTVSEITERLWAEYEAFASRDLSEFEVIYLFVDGIADRLHLGQPREAVLKAGIVEDGLLRRTIEGSPQGGVISPCLSNIFLHHVLDERFEHDVRPRLKGNVPLSASLTIAEDPLGIEHVLERHDGNHDE